MDIDLGGVDDFYELRDIIDRHRDWISRGFVYVAWRQRARNGSGPFFYIGRAESNDRLDLNRHAKLSLAVKPATLLTIIFPTSSSPTILAGVDGVRSLPGMLAIYVLCGARPAPASRPPRGPRRWHTVRVSACCTEGAEPVSDRIHPPRIVGAARGRARLPRSALLQSEAIRGVVNST